MRRRFWGMGAVWLLILATIAADLLDGAPEQTILLACSLWGDMRP